MSKSRWFHGAAVALAICPAAGADMVTDWNNVTLDVIRAVPLNPPVATRTLALVHTSIHDALNGLDRQYKPYLVNAFGPVGASPDLTAAYAAYTVLITLQPGQAALLDQALQDTTDGFPNDNARRLARQWGRKVARQILEERENDGWNDVIRYEPTDLVGRWRPTPPLFTPYLLPHWGFVTAWAIVDGDAFRPAGPPPLDSAEYATAYNEVKDLGRLDSESRTEDQTIIAYFWEDGGASPDGSRPASVTPPGHWHVIAQELEDDFGDNTLHENARLYALLAIAQADAAIAVWDGKLFYDHARPYNGIVQDGDIDGNDDTEGDPTWLSEIPTPPFPAYTSGHSGFSRGSARILELFYGTDDHEFCGMSPDPERWDILEGVIRCWDSFSEAAEEAGQSRIYGGIHWQYDNVDSLDLGFTIADYVFANYLQPVD